MVGCLSISTRGMNFQECMEVVYSKVSLQTQVKEEVRTCTLGIEHHLLRDTDSQILS